MKFHSSLDRIGIGAPTAAISPGRLLRPTLVAMASLIFAVGDSDSAAIGQSADFAGSIRLAKIDSGVTHYATFQSHNQKVVANQYGIFTSHIRDRDKPYQSQTWRLSRSTDGGATFSVVYEQAHATNPPVLETDRAGNVYLIRVNFKSGDAFLYRFDAAKNFQDPAITTIPGAAAGKYAMMLDQARERLFFFAHNNSFNRIKLDGTVEYRTNLLQGGQHGVLQYPLLALSDTGQLHAGWTTQKRGVYLYWDIHHMSSPDQGGSWHDWKGQAIEIPVVADDQGAGRPSFSRRRV